VYARHPGAQHRSLHYQDPKLKQELDELEHKRRWAEIFESRHNNIALNELCSKVEVLYELSKKNK
jgi:hypothetical protein